MIRIGLIDKNELFRLSVKNYIESLDDIEVKLNSESFEDFSICLRPNLIDILIVDIANVDEQEKVILERIIHDYPMLKVMVLTDSVSRNIVMEYINIGIGGFFSKSVNTENLKKAILDVLENKNSFDVILGDHVRQTIVSEEVKFKEKLNNNDLFFSSRELQVLHLVSREKSNVDIANILNVSVRTIETHRRRMIAKTNSRTIVGVLMYAIDNGVQIGSKEAIGA